MKNRLHSGIPAARLCSKILAVLPVAILSSFAADPSWWQERGVTDATQTLNDYAAVNVGQVKNIATKAGDELEANLPGGAGFTIQTLISSFSQITQDRNDYAAVNVGQAKALAKPFYDRLIAAGYCSSYPWSDSDPARNDFAQVNVGQVKNLFSFDLTFDSNNNGLPDWWEIGQFGSLGATNGAGSGDYDSDGLTNAEEYWLRTNPKQSADTSASASASIGLVVYTDFLAN